MGRLNVLLLSVSISLCVSLVCYGAETVTQETTGNQAPAVYVTPGATSNITYTGVTIEQHISEIRRQWHDCLDASIAFQRQKLEELNDKLAEFAVRNEGVPEKNAKEWARDVLEKAPELKKSMKEDNAAVRKYNEELSKDLLAKVYNTFVYIFETVDPKLLALREISPKAKYTRGDRFLLFPDESAQMASYTARSLVFANGNRITLVLSLGSMKQGLVQTCPSLEFTEFAGQTQAQSFRVKPDYGRWTSTIVGGVELKKERAVADVKYPATGADMLTDSFKEEFNRAFTEFIEFASTRMIQHEPGPESESQ